MSLIAAGVTAGIGALGGLIGGNKAAKQRRKMDRYLNKQDAENDAWYNENFYSDYTQRSDTQNLISNLRKQLDRNNKVQANSAVVTGASIEHQAAAKEQANNVIADTYSNIGAMGQRWKDNITSNYQNRKQAIANQRMGMMDQKAQSYENLMNNGLDMMGGGIGNLLGGLIK